MSGSTAAKGKNGIYAPQHLFVLGSALNVVHEDVFSAFFHIRGRKKYVHEL